MYPRAPVMVNEPVATHAAPSRAVRCLRRSGLRASLQPSVGTRRGHDGCQQDTASTRSVQQRGLVNAYQRGHPSEPIHPPR